jgi:hypothetical protein
MTGKVGRRGRGGNFLWKNIFFVFFTLPDIRTKQGPQRVMGFAWKPAIKAMYNKELDVHFDGTFMMTHNGFQQVCVLRIRDHSSRKHLPVYYILMSTTRQHFSTSSRWLVRILLGKRFF